MKICETVKSDDRGLVVMAVVITGMQGVVSGNTVVMEGMPCVRKWDGCGFGVGMKVVL